MKEKHKCPEDKTDVSVHIHGLGIGVMVGFCLGAVLAVWLFIK